jgi:endonuclease YncB( thermonuclease family)
MNKSFLTSLFALFGIQNARKWIALLVVLGGLWTIWQKSNGVSAITKNAYEGKVIAVSDGDTIKVLTADMQTHKIRFANVDAPEKAMPYGQEAKATLSAKIFGRSVRVEVETIDQYQREVGRIFLDDRDINLAQLAEGYAWHYVQYARKGQNSVVFNQYNEAQQAAKEQHLGLWQDVDPTPPWDWRRAKKAR